MRCFLHNEAQLYARSPPVSKDYPLQCSGMEYRELNPVRQKFLSFHLPLRIAIGGALIVAAVTKATNLFEFDRSLSVAFLVTPHYARSVSLGILATEIFVGLGLLFSGGMRAATFALLLSSAFMSYGAWRLIAHIEAPCNCFGPLLSLSPIVSAVVATCFCLLTASLYVLTHHKEQIK